MAGVFTSVKTVRHKPLTVPSNKYSVRTHIAVPALTHG